jgi:hypothetical protein
LQDRLKAIELRLKNNVVDVTIMFYIDNRFTPLMPQNKWKNNCKTLLERNSTLDDVERTLHEEDL